MTTNRIGRATTRRGLMLVVLAAALWGTSGVATKTIYSLVEVSPISVAAFRLALGAPMLLAAFRITSGSRSFRIARADFAWLLLAGASLGLSQACYFAAIARVGVAVATLVTICTAPVLVCLCSAALLRERPTAAVGGALVFALIGTVLLIGVGQREAGPQAGAALGGTLLALIAAFCFAAFILVSRLLSNRYHPLLAITIAVSIGAVLLLAVAAITIGVTVRYPWAVWALFLYLGLVPTALGYAFSIRVCSIPTASEASIARPGRASDFDWAGNGHLRRAARPVGVARRRAADQRHRVPVPEWLIPVRVSRSPAMGGGWRSALAIGLVFSLVYVAASYVIGVVQGIDPGQGYDPGSISRRVVQGIAGWAMIVAVLGLGARPRGDLIAFSKPVRPDESPRPTVGARLMAYAGEAFLPVYILHQTVIIAIGYTVVQWHIAGLLKYLVISLASLALTLLIYELAIRRTRPTRWIFGMKARPGG